MIINTKEFITRKIEDKYVFLKFSNGDSHLIDETGTVFLEEYLKNNDTDTAVRALQNIYPNVPKKIIENDFKEFIELLINKGILI